MNRSHFDEPHATVGAMPLESAYRVGMVAKLTGLTTHTLRTWERRYGAVVPGRTDAGGRLYSSEDVQRLRLLREAVDAGHAIGTVATLADPELVRLAEDATRSAAGSETRAELPPVAAFLDAVERLDVGAAEAVMARASVSMEPERFLMEVVAPALREVGARWERAEFRIAHERVATAAARGLLFSLARLYPRRDGQGTVVVAAPRGDHHEVGGLMVAMLAAMHGFTVVYLGADVPEDEIAYVAEVRTVELVLLSIVHLTQTEVQQVARTLAAAVPEGVRIIAGGSASAPVAGTRVEHLPSLASLDVLLRSMTA